MYLKLTNESEVRLLRQINCLLEKKKLPNGVLGTARRIIEKEQFTVHDCVVIFMNPIKNDTIGICDELRIYPYTVETDEDYIMNIKVQKGTEVEWSGYMIRIKETGGRIYLIYPMRKQDVKKRNGLYMEEIYMEYVMIGTGMAVAITCILILEMIEYRRIKNA